MKRCKEKETLFTTCNNLKFLFEEVLLMRNAIIIFYISTLQVFSDFLNKVFSLFSILFKPGVSNVPPLGRTRRTSYFLYIMLKSDLHN